ncbi:hypothetical protein B0H11DRAFT_1969802 [Mycena galericulata]|nr:hypothetical protein B0H11DRAFT_1969802 [Mycena galericulata]
MFHALTTFLLASQAILGRPEGVRAALLVPVPAVNFNSETLQPPASSSGDLVFNWHDSNDTSDHNAVDTQIFELTAGGNSSLSNNSTGAYVIEAMAVQFNQTHFTQNASSTPWIAIFQCTTNSSAGNTSDLISNAQRLGAHAILAYTEDSSYSYCNLTDNTPPVTIPIYVTENWDHGSLVFSDQLSDFFGPSKIKFYDSVAMNTVATNITSDFNALRSKASSLTDVILAQIPAISTNTSVVSTSGTSTSTSAPSKTPSSAVRWDASGLSVVILASSLLLSVGW